MQKDVDVSRCSGIDPVALLNDAKKRVTEAKSMPVSKLTQEVDAAQLAIVLLRDCLIACIRAGDGAAFANTRNALDLVNTALTLLVGVEYPVTGIHRNMLDEAARVLDQIPVR